MAECITPFTIRDKMTNESQAVPCGKCPNCYKRRISGWSFRLMQEYKVSTSAYFITLTYDTCHVPISRNGFMELSKRDCQLFFKRLRKTNSNGIKYYLAAEYGGKTKRPHYHVILFNAKLETIQPAWSLGQIHYGAVNVKSVGYTLKYMSKPKNFRMHRNDDRTAEFGLMSKGLGINYVSDAMVKWHKSDIQNRMFCPIEDGKKIAMPRYYKQKIYEEDERRAAGVSTRARMLIERDKLELDPDYFRNKMYSDLAQFDKMEYESNQRSKI